MKNTSICYFVNDTDRYIIFTYLKSGMNTINTINNYILNKPESEILGFMDDGEYRPNFNRFKNLKFNISLITDDLDKYKDYKKILVYRDPYERVVSLFYNRYCGITSYNDITNNYEFFRNFRKLNKKTNTFNKFLDKLFEKELESKDNHYYGQKKPNIDFDQIINIKEIHKIFENTELNNKVTEMINNNFFKNELSKYDYSDNLVDYDFCKDELKLVNNHTIPSYNCLLNDTTINKIKNNYDDDFL